MERTEAVTTAIEEMVAALQDSMDRLEVVIQQAESDVSAAAEDYLEEVKETLAEYARTRRALREEE